MLKPVPSIISALAVALVTVSTAAAITGGSVDGDAHPYVGALVVDGFVECSGVLVSPTVFATAGHCAADGTRVSVSFDSKLGTGLESRERNLPRRSRQASRSGRRRARCSDQRSSPRPCRPQDRPTRSSRKTLVTSVGYGYSSWAADGSFVYDGFRRVATRPSRRSTG